MKVEGQTKRDLDVERRLLGLTKDIVCTSHCTNKSVDSLSRELSTIVSNITSNKIVGLRHRRLLDFLRLNNVEAILCV